MKVLNKIAIGASFGALAIALAGGVDASAAEPKAETDAASPSGITISNTKEMTINSSSLEVYVSFDAFKKNGSLNDKAKWDVYPTSGGSVQVDLSNVKTTKDSYIAVKNGEEKILYQIKKDDTKYKGKVESGAINLENGDYLYRTEAGDFKSYTVNDTNKFQAEIKKYEQQGATIYFRKAGKANVLDGVTASEKDGYTSYEIDGKNFVSKEFKVKVPKAGKQPTIPVDYTKGIFKKKSSLQYCYAASLSGIYAKPDDDKKWTDLGSELSVQTLGASGGVIQMRTKAKGKKSPSKIAVFEWDELDQTAINATSGSSLLASTELANGKTAELKVAEAPAPKTDDKAYVKLTASEADYMIYDAEPTAASKPKVTVKATQTKKVTKKQLSGKIWIRTAGQKPAKKNNYVSRFPSIAGALDKLPYATPTPTPTQAPNN